MTKQEAISLFEQDKCRVEYGICYIISMSLTFVGFFDFILFIGFFKAILRLPYTSIICFLLLQLCLFSVGYMLWRFIGKNAYYTGIYDKWLVSNAWKITEKNRVVTIKGNKLKVTGDAYLSFWELDSCGVILEDSEASLLSTLGTSVVAVDMSKTEFNCTEEHIYSEICQLHKKKERRYGKRFGKYKSARFIDCKLDSMWKF